MGVASRQEQTRSSRRAFIRSHHPDRGGDPTLFATGLRAWDNVLNEPPARVVAVAAKPWPRTLLTVLARRMRKSRRLPRVR